MARQKNSTKAKTTETLSIPLADQLFAVVTHRYENAAASLLPQTKKKQIQSITGYAAANKDKIAVLQPITEIVEVAPRGHLISAVFTRLVSQSSLRYVARAAVLLVVVVSGLTLMNLLGDDTIRIEDELGKSALNNEFGAKEKSVSLRVMRKRKKIGEFTVREGSTLKVVKASVDGSFKTEVAFAGNEADFALKYKGKASVIVNNGPFSAKVKIPQAPNNEVYLRFRELGTALPIGDPEFSIEVIKGNVQIAEVDDDLNFKPYTAGEKVVFTLDDSENL
ncbi:MAG: hypothetical protein JSR44_15070 [Spirochaetes bacterium]|nr:hypothetical protein [Spirochaetota bacterium]